MPTLTDRQKFMVHAQAAAPLPLPPPPKVPDAIKNWFAKSPEWRAAWDAYDQDWEEFFKKQRISGLL